jgi:predicted DCC family thiol-disulfide oxidoreductase YuxK
MSTIPLENLDEKVLPSPRERPAGDVVVFDGHCRICTGQIHLLNRWDRRGMLAFLSLHDPEVQARYPDVSHDELMKQMLVVDPHGRRHWGADAFRYLSRRLRRLWWLAPFLHLPFTMPVWRWLYDQVANRRYLFGRKAPDCDSGTCSLHHGH